MGGLSAAFAQTAVSQGILFISRLWLAMTRAERTVV